MPWAGRGSIPGNDTDFSPPGSTPCRGHTKPPIQRPSWYTSTGEERQARKASPSSLPTKKIRTRPYASSATYSLNGVQRDSTVSTCRCSACETDVCSHTITIYSNAGYTNGPYRTQLFRNRILS
jgi:hypothetical protein